MPPATRPVPVTPATRPLSAPPVAASADQPIAGSPAPGTPYGAPPVGPPAFVPPQSGPPFAPVPQSGPPYPPVPQSGPPYGQPGFPPPGAVPPSGASAPAPRRRSRAAIVLGLVAGLLLVFGGVMTALFVTTRNDLDGTEKRLAAAVTESGNRATELEKLRGELKSAQDRLADTQQDLTGTRNDRDEQARQKRVIANCLNRLTTALGAAARNDQAGFSRASQGLEAICDEAERYL
ncbi:hypothetical protein AWW66_30960 [Micromonospora rosaria]|uniref:Uncharacterized protein n=1 Tax=Micromonospora rosaria TaxID=47874 RepID=A0A136PIJ9_9ACTN|nr:hypothetical protein AWW66_30960 [Micromonospora rosaria]